jgi:hypothetical protein
VAAALLDRRLRTGHQDRRPCTGRSGFRWW